jgi:hypothetical protein
MFLWAEACNTAVYLQNRNPLKVLGRMTPEEAFTRKKPKIGHIRIFGCQVYFHVLAERSVKSKAVARAILREDG